MLSEEETRKIIRGFISSTGAASLKDRKGGGRGDEGTHRKDNPGLAKKIAEEILGAPKTGP